MEQVILIGILLIIVIVLLMFVSVMSTFTTVARNTNYDRVGISETDPIKKPLGPMALSDHYPEPSGTIDDGTDVVAIADLPDVAQKSEQIDWVKDGGKTIVDLGASCGEIKAFDPTRLYPGQSSDQYANYCNSMHSNRECQDRTCSIPLIMYACRDGCTDGLQASQRRARIGKGAERITYQEYRAWKDGTPYPGSGESTWEEHCAWKDSVGFEGLGAGAEPCSQNYNMHEAF